MIVPAVLTVIGGLVAVLAGGYGLHRSRRAAVSGQTVSALVKPPQRGSDRPLVQFETADGRVVEVVSPVPRTRRRPLPAGSEVRIVYDADDPREIVLPAGASVRTDLGFVVAGAALVVLGAVLVATAP
ncbi:hypothetical protein GUY60_23500 [Streptomyces sp. YC537]|uniref:DUF3592 domain-containing protein n=1 Tax=Streptomyces boluensis TaxID=1775135 RepID=A0A964URY3_9ACTN|nr:hypothetical protein [Streptomyces boluensis]